MNTTWILSNLALALYVGGVVGVLFKYREYGIKGARQLTCVAAPLVILTVIFLFIRHAVTCKDENTRTRIMRFGPRVVLAFRLIPVIAGLIAVGIREVLTDTDDCPNGGTQSVKRSRLRRSWQLSHAAVRVLDRECFANSFGDS